MPENGSPIETPRLPATGDAELAIQDFRGNPLVIFFYPRDNTPGCTKEGQAFRDLYSEFEKAGCAIVGVSRDSVKSHENFAARHEFPFPLIADTDEVLCTTFDVIKEKNMYGRKVMGIERSTFLLDASGRIAREWRKVKVPGHAEAVLEAVRELG
ncbi:peroxiredoxin [Wenzhouxiangella sp. XN79A]|uniref:peroxiredoxin n=1 Tax=Wenzhouxiangella sp. XN79A TaxID=2724193 RepID=UPI00144AE9E7|nr:peroxiredoxin [Wenzhouxiangella sp. XN79A]NKI35451.1 peroxiredoxin [Wenzhouxiangella sp. XN79A]